MLVPNRHHHSKKAQKPRLKPQAKRARLEALRDFTLLMLRNHGNASDAEISKFLSAGYTHQNMLEVVLGLAQKTISNYINHLARTPVDKQYEKYAWSKWNKIK